jgi:D-alanine-D-alanine ligase
MQVAILHNQVCCGASLAEQDVLVQVDAVRESLARLGHEPLAVPVSLDLASLVRRLEAGRPDVAFNLVESLGGSDRLMFLPTALLDVLRIPYTGSPTEAILSSGDKPAAKLRLAQAGLPTPEWLVDGREGDCPDFRGAKMGLSPRKSGQFPRCRCPEPGGRYIIKPIWEHASLGMDGESVLSVPGDDPNTVAAALARKLADRARQTGHRSFAERFVEGREFNLSLLASRDGPQVLPSAEIDFSAFAEDELRIVGYDAKWNDRSPAYHNTPRTFDFAPADGPLLGELARLARASWGLFGLRGYARVDFRVDTAGRPWILEINANPCLSPDAGFAAAADRASIGFDRAIERILEDAVSETRES